MRKCINVYSLPRSGTNLLAGYLMQHPKIVSHNVAGGRHPFRANFESVKHEIFAGPGVHKNYEMDTYYLRDELKFTYIGPRVSWPEQAIFKLYDRIFRSLNKSVVLLRNPYAIASSMLDYVIKNGTHRHVWDVSRRDQMLNFVSQFSNLLRNSRVVLRQGGIIIDAYSFFTLESVRSELFDFLGLDITDMKKIEYCKRGHKFEVYDNHLSCPCGKLKGFGGFNPFLQTRADRLLTNKEYANVNFLSTLNSALDFRLGKRISSYFCQNGHTDMESLLMDLNW